MRKVNLAVGVAAAAFSTSAIAAETAKGAEPDRFQIEPLLDARLRYENVDQRQLDANSLTLRLRAGAEAKLASFSLLAEGEGTVALVNNYNAFPFAIADDQRRPQYAAISDPQNLELNRLQLQYRFKNGAVTAGRQRINLDDQRWVGSVGWRQNEQTFDAVRGEAKLGPVAADLTYAISQRTIFGEDAGPRTAFDGHFLLAGVGAKLGPIQTKLFSYLLDYDESFFLMNSSQTYGGFLSTSVPLGKKGNLSLRASYARQSDYADNPFNYAANYWSFEAGAKIGSFNLTGGWERLGSDNGRAVQTPMATLHKFNGWADLFLTTPPTGLKDAYVAFGTTIDGIKFLPGLNANVTFHQFDSAAHNIKYGTEWDSSAGFKIGKIGVLLKFADYNAKSFGVDTRKLWLQAEWAL